MTRPRNDPPVRVGDRLNGGELSGGIRPNGKAWINCNRGSSVGVELDPVEAEDFCVRLLERIRATDPDPGRLNRRRHLPG